MDSRRRGAPSRPASSEEVECWTHASESLKALSSIYAKPAFIETVGRVNRLITAWPTDDSLPAEGLSALQTIQTKLSSGLGEISAQSDREINAIDNALERIGVLIALRKAPEVLPTAEKRNKRPRAPSPSGTPVPIPSALGNSRSVSITLPARTSSVGPTSNLRDGKVKRDSFIKQPLQTGRKVVFRPPKSADAEEGTWIVAKVTRVISAKDGGKYEVQDVEPQEDGSPGLTYTANSKSIVPLPDKDAPPGSSSSLSQYPIFPVKSTVLALYPDTSCFYRAEIMEAPVDRSSSSTKYTATYKVRFDEDDGLQHNVSAYWVVQFPAHLLGGPKQNGPK